MKTIRAIVIGIVLWVLIFLEVCILMFGFGVTAGPLYYLFQYTLIAAFSFLCALVYFKKVKPNLREGVLLGLIMLATGLALDAAVTVPFFVQNWYYFYDTRLILGYIEGFFAIVFIGVLKRR